MAVDDNIRALATRAATEFKSVRTVIGSKIAIGEYHFGGCSAGKMQDAGNYSLRVGFMLTQEPKRYRLRFENYVGLEDYYSDATGITIGNVYLGEESNVAAEDFTYAATPTVIATGGALTPGPPNGAGGAYVTPWITPTSSMRYKDYLLTYDLNLTSASWLAYTYGSRGFITGPQSKATELTTSTSGNLPWYETVGSFLTIKVEYEYEKAGVTSVIAIGDSTADGWEMSPGGRQGWRGQLTGFPQRWARQTGNTVAVNAYGTSQATRWGPTSPKWARINPSIVPDAVIISMGGNDLQAGVAMASIQTNIMAMIDKCYSMWPGAQVYISTIIPPLSATAAQLASRETLNTWISELSPRKVAGIIDMSVIELPSGLADPRYIGVDGLHLNPRGHARVAFRRT